MKSSIVVPPEGIDDLYRSIILNTAIDFDIDPSIVPLGYFDQEGFRSMIQEFINFGARYGAQAHALFKNPAMFTKRMIDIHASGKEKLKEVIQNASLMQGFYGLTLDTMIDISKQCSFSSVTLHLVDDSFIKQAFLLAVVDHDKIEVESELPTETAENTRKFLLDRLADYFEESTVSEIWGKMIAVTDDGSNVKNVMPNSIPSMTHRLNLALEWTFQKEDEKKKVNATIDSQINHLSPSATPAQQAMLMNKFILSTDAPDVSRSITDIKAVFLYFRQWGLNSQLDTRLKGVQPNRWNCYFPVLKSFLDSESSVRNILEIEMEIDMLQNIDSELMKDLLQILAEFEEVFKILSDEKTPTIAAVVPAVAHLRKFLQPAPGVDKPDICSIKKQLLVCMQEYCQFEDIHLAAYFLNPHHKKMTLVTPAEMSRGKFFIRKRFQMVHPEAESNMTGIASSEPDVASSSSSSTSQRAKVQKLEDFVLYGDDEENSGLNYDAELWKYENSKKPNTADFDLLSYWKQQSEQFPGLRIVALQILAIPASQAWDADRVKLNSKTVEALSFLNKNQAAINESCFFNEQCEALNFQTECRDGRCICRFEMSPVVNKDGTIECKGKNEPIEPVTYVDPAMIGVLVGMALMFVIICVVLRLFSR
ncbi:hypothetical protein DMENIID0001_086820 [Sergentomyia squamirostris]